MSKVSDSNLPATDIPSAGPAFKPLSRHDVAAILGVRVLGLCALLWPKKSEGEGNRAQAQLEQNWSGTLLFAYFRKRRLRQLLLDHWFHWRNLVGMRGFEPPTPSSRKNTMRIFCHPPRSSKK